MESKKKISPFDLTALIEALPLVAEEKEEEEYGPPIMELHGIRLKKPYQVFSYQRDAVLWLEAREKENVHGMCGGILNIEMGLGKTLIVLLRIMWHILHLRTLCQRTYPTLVVCPKSLLKNWKEECERFFGPGLRCLIFFPEWMEPKTLFQTISLSEIQSYHIVVTTYQTVARQAKQTPRLSMKGPGVLFQPWCRIVVDESHKFANMKGKQFQALMELQAPRKIALTGTMIRNYDSDMMAQLKFLGYNLETKKWSAEVYQQLQLYQVVYVLTKEQAGIKLPAFTEKVIDCPLNTVEQEIYSQYEERAADVFQATKKSGAEILKAITRWRQICISAHLLPPEDISAWQPLPPLSSKLQTLVSLLKSIPAPEKVIVFSDWVRPFLLLEKAQVFCMAGNNYVLVHGKLKSKEREACFHQWKTDVATRFLFMTFGVGDVGLNLTEGHVVVFLNPWWSPVAEIQAGARSYRLGQKHDVQAYHLLIPESIETKIQEICKKKLLLGQQYMSKSMTTLLCEEMFPVHTQKKKKKSTQFLSLDQSLE